MCSSVNKIKFDVEWSLEFMEERKMRGILMVIKGKATVILGGILYREACVDSLTNQIRRC